jgi:hypothetical protein
MSFFSGKLTFLRFRIKGPSPGMFGPEHLKRLQEHTIGKQRVASSDGVEVGWIAGGHILDTSFDLAKNIVNDVLQWALRVDTFKIPSDLLRAYAHVELEGLAANNPSGKPSQRQKREARELARERLEQEARDGRFLKRKAFPVLWDGQSNELLVGTTSSTAVDRLHTVFEHTFGMTFEPLTAGRLAFQLAELQQQTRGVDDASPSPFLPGLSPTEFAWVPDETSRDYLGNEYLLWLWYILENESDTLKLMDDSEATLMLARTLVLECPRGKTGRESINSDVPTRLPESRRAIQAGKLPRKVGMTVVRHDQQYELTLTAENLAVSAARMPAPESVEERARLEDRVSQLRHLLETLDLLYAAFVRRRASEHWPRDLARMQQWLASDEKTRLAATA